MSRATPHYRLWLLCILTAGVLISAVSLGTHPTSASPSVSPTPTPTLTPTQQRASQVVRAFYAAYNRRNIPAILALLPNGLRYNDCDYAHHHAVFLRCQFTAESAQFVYGQSAQGLYGQRAQLVRR